MFIDYPNNYLYTTAIIPQHITPTQKRKRHGEMQLRVLRHVVHKYIILMFIVIRSVAAPLSGDSSCTNKVLRSTMFNYCHTPFRPPLAKMAPPLFSKKKERGDILASGGTKRRETTAPGVYIVLALKKHMVKTLHLKKERLNSSKYIHLYIIATLFEPVPNHAMYLF